MHILFPTHSLTSCNMVCTFFCSALNLEDSSMVNKAKRNFNLLYKTKMRTYHTIQVLDLHQTSIVLELWRQSSCSTNWKQLYVVLTQLTINVVPYTATINIHRFPSIYIGQSFNYHPHILSTFPIYSTD